MEAARVEACLTENSNPAIERAFPSFRNERSTLGSISPSPRVLSHTRESATAVEPRWRRRDPSTDCLASMHIRSRPGAFGDQTILYGATWTIIP